ncbi:hypothetical protein ACFL27_04375 [candidate division CSSED10-310 bacterium]|uniref:Uncharacterized protein n=1 Tax=candidate division CSSED10-310 bacterium TaxID=2855610 RepID=A0ABV6YTB6_UNCC1
MKSRSNRKILLERFEELAAKLGIIISYERGLEGPGGLCRIKDQNMILINRNLTVQDKIDVIVDSIIQFPLDNHYILPELREYLENASPKIE